jgi:hypothetical protein
MLLQMWLQSGFVVVEARSGLEVEHGRWDGGVAACLYSFCGCVLRTSK